MHNNCCKNGCKFAVKYHLMSYANKNEDGTYSDADYLYTCTILGHTVSFDSTVYTLGCATFEYGDVQARVTESLVTMVEEKVSELEKMVSQTGQANQSIQESGVQPVTESEPEFIAEPIIVKELTIDVPIHNIVVEKVEPTLPVAEPQKKRGRKPLVEASVVNPVVPETQNV